MKEKIKLLKNICKEECDRIYMEYDIDLEYDHYDSEVRTVYLRESPKSANPSNFGVLEFLENEIKKEIDPKWNVGILCMDKDSDIECGEKEDEF